MGHQLRKCGDAQLIISSGTWTVSIVHLLTGWTCVAVVRAVADSPLGPFHYLETVVPRFAHEPNVVTAEDGSVVMFFFAANCSSGQCGPQQNCSRKEMWPWSEMNYMKADTLERSNELSAIELSGETKLNL